jgi:hypothetical protein
MPGFHVVVYAGLRRPDGTALHGPPSHARSPCAGPESPPDPELDELPDEPEELDPEAAPDDEPDPDSGFDPESADGEPCEPPPVEQAAPTSDAMAIAWNGRDQRKGLIQTDCIASRPSQGDRAQRNPVSSPPVVGVSNSSGGFTWRYA